MKTIKMISGSYGADNGRGGVRVIDRGQFCCVDDAEADRLVAIGVAVLAVATPQETQCETGTGGNAPNEEAQQKDTASHLDVGQLSAMTNAQLKRLAEDMALDASKCRVKNDYVALISAAEVAGSEESDTVEDGEQPPELGAEAPVV